MSYVANNKTSDPGLAAVACLGLVGVLLALSLVVAKLASQAAAPPLGFLMVSMFGAAIILLVVSALLLQAPVVLNRHTLEYGVVAGSFFAIPNAIAFLAVPHVGAGFLSLSFAFPILLTYAIALGLGIEKIRRGRVMGMFAGLAGGVVLSLSKLDIADGVFFWIVLAMMSPVLIAIANIYRTLRWPTGVSPVFLAALMLFGGAGALLPVVVWAEPDVAGILLSSTEILTLLLTEITIFSVLYVFYFVLQKIAGPVYLSQIGSVAAIVGTTVSVLFLGESLPAYFLVSAGLILGGTVLFQRSKPA